MGRDAFLQRLYFAQDLLKKCHAMNATDQIGADPDEKEFVDKKLAAALHEIGNVQQVVKK